MHKRTHNISKVKPKIRIIHIFAPEIIKINAENFREVVQRLTGKPTGDNMAKKSKRMDAGCCTRIKGEEEIWRGANSSSGFAAEIDGFMQDIFNQFPIVEEY